MKRRATALLFLLGIASALGLLFLFDPEDGRLYPPCPFHALTGLECPGCGSTRAAHQMLHGNLVNALKLNPLLPAYAPLAGYALASALLLALRGRPLPELRVRSSVVWLLLGTIVAFWIFRNTPLYPFDT